jgi:hypothetical protein
MAGRWRQVWAWLVPTEPEPVPIPVPVRPCGFCDRREPHHHGPCLPTAAVRDWRNV